MADRFTRKTRRIDGSAVKANPLTHCANYKQQNQLIASGVPEKVSFKNVISCLWPEELTDGFDFRAPVSGIYLIKAELNWDTKSGGDRLGWIAINDKIGVGDPRHGKQYMLASNNDWTGCLVVALVKVKTNDIISIYADHNAVGNAQIRGANRRDGSDIQISLIQNMY